MRNLIVPLAGRKLAGRCVVLYCHGVSTQHKPEFERQMDDLLRFAEPTTAARRAPLESGRRYAVVTVIRIFEVKFSIKLRPSISLLARNSVGLAPRSPTPVSCWPMPYVVGGPHRMVIAAVISTASRRGFVPGEISTTNYGGQGPATRCCADRPCGTQTNQVRFCYYHSMRMPIWILSFHAAASATVHYVENWSGITPAPRYRVRFLY